MRRILTLAALLLTAPACIVAVDADRNRGGDDDTPWWHPDNFSDDEEDSDVQSDTDADWLDVQLTFNPSEVLAGDTTLILGTLDGDADARSLMGLGLGDGVEILNLRILGRHDLAVAVDVAAGASGFRDAILDFGELGRARVDSALSIVATGDTDVADTDAVDTDAACGCP